MRYISPSEYAAINKRKGQEISLGYVYKLMRDEKLPWVEVQTMKRLKRIPWDDDKAEVVKLFDAPVNSN